jgi:hypothetical protein
MKHLYSFELSIQVNEKLEYFQKHPSFFFAEMFVLGNRKQILKSCNTILQASITTIGAVFLSN